MTALLFVPLLVAECFADAAENHITIAALPCYDAVTTLKKLNKLAAYLRDQVGVDVKYIVPTEIEVIKSSLQNGDIDFILQDPHTYVQTSGFLNRGSILTALAWDGTSSQRGVMIARKDSGIKQVSELKGKSVMFGPKLSIAKWIAARELFDQHGINIDKDLKAYSHGGCCEDIAFHVFLKAVDAGAVCDDFLEEGTENKTELGIDLAQIIAIGRTGRFPTRVFAARLGLDSELLARVNQALLKLDRQNPEHQKILGPAELGGFLVARDQDYDSMRTLMGENRP